MDQITEDDIYRFQKAFHDSSLGDGEITVDRVMAIFAAMDENPPKQEVAQLVRSLNQRANVNFGELLRGMSNLIKVSLPESDLKTAFEAFDADKNGMLTPDELSSVFYKLNHKMSPKEVNELVACLDADNSGTIDYKEFVTMMTS